MPRRERPVPDLGTHFGEERRSRRAPGASVRPSLATEQGRVQLAWMDGREGDRAIFTTRGFVYTAPSPEE